MSKRDPTPAACAFLFVLLLTPVSPKCRQGTVDECKAAESAAGINFVGATFDITTLMKSLFVYHGGYLGGVCTLCENPLLPGNPLQRRPRSLAVWKPHIVSEQKVQHSVHLSPIAVAEGVTKLQVTNDWGKELDLKMTLGDKVQWALAGSRSSITKLSITNRDKYHFLLHQFTSSCYSFQINKTSQLLTWHFKNDVNQLPQYYDSYTKRDYQQLIEHYGTHVATELELGGRTTYFSKVPVCETAIDNVSISELSHCLGIDWGIGLGLEGLTHSPDFKMCEEKKKNPDFSHLLHKVGSSKVSNDKEWMEIAKSYPTLLSSSLEPLHTLLDKTDPRREGLRKAVSEYVRENALWRNCNQPCPAGTQLSATDFCSCECPTTDLVNSMCCTPKRGLAKLTVIIESAHRLWGNFFSRTDGYVSVAFQKKRLCTHTVWNNNNPEWKVALDFGVVQLNEKDQLQVEVWDEDRGWNDQCLGKCKVNVINWPHSFKQCRLKHGFMTYRYTVNCAHNLDGPLCRQFHAQLPSYNNEYNYNT